MKTVTFLTIAIAIGWSQILNAKTQTSEAKPRIEVCFVLDTTGSMGGLIEGAKQKIWSIANEMISTKPTPELKLGLIGYRDRGDEYVVKSFQLTDDIDSIYGHLRDFKAEGGGDEPESVNEALAEAIEKMPWSQDRKVLKIIFLVGDAPPHLDYADGPKYPELCRIAAKKDLIINTVQCGNIAETTPIWKEIAKLSEGSYAAIAQSGGVAVIATPMDNELARLNKKIGATLIPYGDAALQREVAAKQAFAESAPDTTRFRLEKNTDKDWLRGDTITAYFDSTVTDTAKKNPDVRRLFASGHATSYYHLSPSDSAEKRPAINYVSARLINIEFDKSKVATVTTVDSVAGVYIEPKADSATVRRNGPTNAPGQTKPLPASIIPLPPKKP